MEIINKEVTLPYSDAVDMGLASGLELAEGWRFRSPGAEVSIDGYNVHQYDVIKDSEGVKVYPCKIVGDFSILGIKKP